jgi:hypothetical protein
LALTRNSLKTQAIDTLLADLVDADKTIAYPKTNQDESSREMLA